MGLLFCVCVLLPACVLDVGGLTELFAGESAQYGEL